MRSPFQPRSALGVDRLVFWALLSGFTFLGFLLRTWTAIFWPRVERPDEIFQNLEPAFRLWTGRGIITWEWRDGIRSLLFPELLAGVMRVTELLNLPQKSAFPMIWALLALVSCGTVVIGVLLGWRHYGIAGAVLCGILAAFWPDLVYYGPKTLVEVQAGNLLVVAAGLVCFAACSQHRASEQPGGEAERSRGWITQGIVGFLLGAAFVLRFQLALALLLTACWSARLDRRRWLALVAGAMIPVAALGLTDWFTLGSPFQSIWKNIAVNLVQGKAVTYGVSPFYDYGLMIVGRYGAAALALVGLFALGFRAAPLLAWVALAVIGFHSAIAHKESSFIFAALPCAMIVAGLGLSRFARDWHGRSPLQAAPRRVLAIVTAATCATIAAVGWMQRPFAPTSPDGDLQALWTIARTQPDLCGLALYTSDPDLWAKSGGQSMLIRPVPIYMPLSRAAFDESRPAFNYVIAHHLLGEGIPDLEKMLCHKEYCLFHQPVQCHPDPTHEMSAELARSAK